MRSLHRHWSWVGVMMAQQLKSIDWEDMMIAAAAFVTIIVMVLGLFHLQWHRVWLHRLYDRHDRRRQDQGYPSDRLGARCDLPDLFLGHLCLGWSSSAEGPFSSPKGVVIIFRNMVLCYDNGDIKKEC